MPNQDPCHRPRPLAAAADIARILGSIIVVVLTWVRDC
jgi:hypothetical protein